MGLRRVLVITSLVLIIAAGTLIVKSGSITVWTLSNEVNNTVVMLLLIFAAISLFVVLVISLGYGCLPGETNE